MRTSWLCVIPVNAIWHCNQPGSCETVYHWFMAIESSPKHNGRAASLCNDSRKQLIKCRRFYSSKCDFKHIFTHRNSTSKVGRERAAQRQRRLSVPLQSSCWKQQQSHRYCTATSLSILLRSLWHTTRGGVNSLMQGNSISRQWPLGSHTS